MSFSSSGLALVDRSWISTTPEFVLCRCARAERWDTQHTARARAHHPTSPPRAHLRTFHRRHLLRRVRDLLVELLLALHVFVGFGHGAPPLGAGALAPRVARRADLFAPVCCRSRGPLGLGVCLACAIVLLAKRRLLGAAALRALLLGARFFPGRAHTTEVLALAPCMQRSQREDGDARIAPSIAA